jgi:hypothetical protein
MSRILVRRYLSTPNSSKSFKKKYLGVVSKYIYQNVTEASASQLKSFYEMLLITFSNDKDSYENLKEKYRLFVE